MNEPPESLFPEIQERLARLESKLPSQIDAMAVSPVSKLPFKALLYRGALLWRMAELGQDALGHFENDRLVSAIQLTRAVVETSAALWYLHGKLDTAVKTQAVADIDTYLMRLLMGSRNNTDLPESINVMTFVDHVEKSLGGFREQYDRLSEFAHPNWAGTSLLYARKDSANRRTDFGRNIRAADNVKTLGVMNFSVSLLMFEKSCDNISRLMPDFVALCERNLQG